MLADLLFILFSLFVCVGALGVVSAKNPVYSVLFMILTFFNAAGLFLLLGAELLALLLVMVYVGAITVMFLFVVMTIDVEISAQRASYSRLAPMAVLVALVLILELLGSAWGGMYQATSPTLVSPSVDNTTALGSVLFTQYVLTFQVVGIVLLVAMIGAIVLTHRQRGNAKRQNITKQIARQRHESIVLTQPDIGHGVSAIHYTGKGVE